MLGDIPVISIKSKSLKNIIGECMIDTGAAPNVVKKSVLAEDAIIDYSTKPRMTGITGVGVYGLGTTVIEFDDFDARATFVVIPDSFPIKTDMLIGAQFCKSCRMILDFDKGKLHLEGKEFPLEEERTVECRADDQVYIDMEIPLVKGQYQTPREIYPNVYLGGTYFTSLDEDRILVPLINKNHFDIKIRVPGRSTIKREDIPKPRFYARDNTQAADAPEEMLIDIVDMICPVPQTCPKASESDDGTCATASELPRSDESNENVEYIVNAICPVPQTCPKASESDDGTCATASELPRFVENIEYNFNERNIDLTREKSDDLINNDNITEMNIEALFENIEVNGNKENIDTPKELRETNEYLNMFYESFENKYDNDVNFISEDTDCSAICINNDEIPEADIYEILTCIEENLDFERETVYVYDETYENKNNFDNAANNAPNSNLARSDVIKGLINIERYETEVRKRLEKICEEHADIFQVPDEKLEATHMIEHKIELIDDIPINVKQYRYPPMLKQEIERQIEKMLKDGIIEPSDSPYNSPLWIVPKKDDSHGNKRWRLVIDYRELNKKTISDAYPIPNINEIIDSLGGANYFSALDLASGFHQIPMRDCDKKKTAFSTPFGHYHFTRMPFGLKNSPATFQRQMDVLFRGLQDREVFIYVDDCIIFSRTIEEHDEKFDKVAARLRCANMRLQPDKCEFYKKEIAYLGHVITPAGILPDPKKVEAMTKFPTPKNQKNVRQLLGLANYYRKFIPHYARETKPLSTLLRKDAPFVWGEKQQKAFNYLIEKLSSQPLLKYPDFTKPFFVTTDASNFAIGAVLSQLYERDDLPVNYFSRNLTGAEINYSTIEKELLAMVCAAFQFRYCLFGRKFTFITDHKPLVWVHNIKDPTSRLKRFYFKLREFDYEVVYKEGKTNYVADALSRNPPVNNSDQLLITSLSNSDSDEIYTPRRVTVEADIHEEPKLQINRSKKSNAPIHKRPPIDDDPIQAASDQTPSDTHDESSDDIESQASLVTQTSSDIFDDVNVPYDENIRDREDNTVEIRDSLLTHRDNVIYFITSDNEALCAGAREIAEHQGLPPQNSPDVGSVHTSVIFRKVYVAVILKENRHTRVDETVLRTAVDNLIEILREKQLKTVRVSVTKPIDDIPSHTIIKLLKEKVSVLPHTKLLICKGLISTPKDTEERQAILERIHKHPINGHKGVNKTYLRIKQDYYWPSLKKDIQLLIKRCEVCQKNKLVRRKIHQPMILTDTPGQAFDKISLDVVGPLAETSDHNSYILTMQCLLTKYVIAVPLPQVNSLSIATAFLNNFVYIYGSPRILLTDQGSNFMSSLMKNIAKLCKTERCTTTAYRPQSNGSIERMHHVLKEYFKCYVKNEKTWDKWLNCAVFTYNTSVHEGTRLTPYECVFGTIARTPVDKPLPLENNETYFDYLLDLKNRINKAQELAQNNLKHAKVRSKEYYDRKNNPTKFEIGDKVLLLKEPKRGQFDCEYTGPHRVVNVHENGVNVEITYGNKTRVVHANKLRHTILRTPSESDA